MEELAAENLIGGLVGLDAEAGARRVGSWTLMVMLRLMTWFLSFCQITKAILSGREEWCNIQ